MDVNLKVTYLKYRTWPSARPFCGQIETCFILCCLESTDKPPMITGHWSFHLNISVTFQMLNLVSALTFTQQESRESKLLRQLTIFIWILKSAAITQLQGKSTITKEENLTNTLPVQRQSSGETTKGSNQIKHLFPQLFKDVSLCVELSQIKIKCSPWRSSGWTRGFKCCDPLVLLVG